MSAKAKNSIKVTKSLFDAAKILMENGANNVEVSKYLKISKEPVAMIRKAETYEEYQQLMYEYSLNGRRRAAAIKAKEQEAKAEPKTENPQEVVKEVRQTVTIQATHYMMQELQKTNELLTGISAKLAFIVDELTK